jgi:molecular chaperone GrpE
MRSSPGTDADTAAAPEQPSAEGLASQLEEARAQLASSEDRYLRARADLENYRKRIERELERRVEERSDAVLRSWFDVVDSVERALALDAASLPRDSLRVLLDQMEGVLARNGVGRLGAVGEQFDPELHEAVSVVPAQGRRPGTIAEIARSGYSVDGRVLRPAQVAVARPPDDAT